MRRLTGFLAAAVVVRMAFHALALPAFEGPDEPQHLARTLDFARRPFSEAFQGKWVDADIIASQLAYPCPSPDVGCTSYGQAPAMFNLLRPAPPPSARPVRRIPNEEAKQPPLFYFLAGLPIRLAGWTPTPPAALLYVRLLCVGLVAIALFGPLRRFGNHSPAAATAALIALLSPGAAEAFARCSNDAAVFLWAAAVLAMLDRRSDALPMAVLIAAGPLIKLTAVPVATLAVVVLWVEKHRAASVAAAAASALVFPIQALRGWTTGGAIELQRRTPEIAESLGGCVLGFVRSAYAMVKMAFWAMGGSVLRPPFALVVIYFAMLLFAVLGIRPRRRPRRLPAHAGAALVAAAGFSVFVVAARRYLGVWGSVGGWYLWDWSPWLAVAASDLITIDRRFVRPLLVAETSFVLAANGVWLTQSGAHYGW